MSATSVNIMIPTLNEAFHIAEAVQNASRMGRVFVLDSLSTDGTQEIARQNGATVIEHRFEDYSKQKNWGIDNIPWDAEWIFILDADERVTASLRREILDCIAREPAEKGFFINRVNLFMGRAIRHGGLFPSWNLRLFRRGKARYEDRLVHEHMICQGKVGHLRHEMLHIRLETAAQYIEKHIKYADLESDEWYMARQRRYSKPERERERLPTSQRLRMWLRRDVSPHLPMSPLIRFLYMYLVRFGFLDGRPGFNLAMLMANYEYMIRMLYKEKRGQIGEAPIKQESGEGA